MPDVSGASRPGCSAATFFCCAVAGCCIAVLFVSVPRSFCAALALAALDDVDHAPAEGVDKAANRQGGMIAATDQFALRNCDRATRRLRWLFARTMHRPPALLPPQ